MQRLSILVILIATCALGAEALGADALSELRAARRARVRAAAAAATLDKDGAGRPFGLLVIPVDFADSRLPAGWQPSNELGPRLNGAADATLANYFHAASGGLCRLKITLAPLVRLPGPRRDYSDVGLNGFTRTRLLASESLTAVRDLGYEFRRLDTDGPDGIAGTADDDGEVDGVLILHAGVGQENDLEQGLIQPLQFFLDEPVVDDGVAASFYAVAAMGSGLGIWAHETAHLLGLEDRYDFRLGVGGGSEVNSLGGLGRFSLMASGAWGTGGGRGPALPDGYSCWQLGWYAARDLPAAPLQPVTLEPAAASRLVHRVWTHGRPDSEFFLLEVRDPAASAPFDAAVPGGQAIVYHVDESVPESSWSLDPPYQLRVQVVEADGDDGLLRGLDDGSVDDLYPGGTNNTALGPATRPDSDGYGGPSQVHLADFATVATERGPGIACTVSAAAGPAVEVDLAFSRGTEPVLALTVASVGTELAAPVARVTATYPPLGAFAGGATTVMLPLVATGDGLWEPATAVAWLPEPDLPGDAATRFQVAVEDGGPVAAVIRTWTWSANAAALDFGAQWPGTWTIAHPDGDRGTTWHRWTDGTVTAPDGGPVLSACGEEFTDGTAWPNITCDVRAHTTLTSAPLGPEITGVRLVHTIESERLAAGLVMDGGVVSWVAPDGSEVLAAPVDGWPERIAPRAYNPLHGRGAFGGDDGLLPDAAPLWRTDVFATPDGGAGPWRLRLTFAGNSRDWQYRGWLIGRLEPLATAPPASALPLAWTEAGLAWTWPETPAGDPRFAVEILQDGAWVEVLDRRYEPPFPGNVFTLPRDEVLAVLPEPPGGRYPLRIVGPLDTGTLASRPVVVFPDGGDGATIAFSLPWPNPSRDGVRFLVTVPAGEAARLGVHDLRGRRLAVFDYPPGEYLVNWDGRDARGRRLASGTYYLRLEGSTGSRTHKVVLIH